MWYFAYGSNLNIRAVTEWCRHYGHRAPTLKPGKPAVLDNYRLCFPIFSEYFGGGIADIVYDPGKYVAGVLFDRVNKPTIRGARPSVMQEEYPLPETPKRCRAEFVRSRGTLRDVVREPGTHMMNQQVGK